MSQIQAALSHYWHLRDQGLSPSTAKSHVIQRFGIAVDTEQPMASTAEVVRPDRPLFEIGQWLDGGPIAGGPVQVMDIDNGPDGEGFRYELRWPKPFIQSHGWDVEKWTRSPWLDAPTRVVAAPVETLDPSLAAGFGEDFCKTITGCTSNPQGLFGTADPLVGQKVRVKGEHSFVYGGWIGEIAGRATASTIFDVVVEFNRMGGVEQPQFKLSELVFLDG